MMHFLVLAWTWVLPVLVAAVAIWIDRRFGRPAPGPPALLPPVFTAALVTSPERIQTAIEHACREAGVNPELLAQSADMVRTGKLDEILYHASVQLGRPIRTLADVGRLLTVWMK